MVLLTSSRTKSGLSGCVGLLRLAEEAASGLLWLLLLVVLLAESAKTGRTKHGEAIRPRRWAVIVERSLARQRREQYSCSDQHLLSFLKLANRLQKGVCVDETATDENGIARVIG